jgi:2-keto-4-pentenoate hydratase/2-oxohepta-3-ene-1,7-dioic acid hydratase in catechol pathway
MGADTKEDVRMKRVLLVLGAASAAAAALVTAQQTTAFKVGTFERQGKTFVGVVLREAVVIDLAAAVTALKESRTAAPTDMKDLIARYDSGVRDLIVSVIGAVGSKRPDYVYDVKALRIRPPIMYPTNVLNMAVNYREHAVEMAHDFAVGSTAPATAGPGSAPQGTTSAPGIWERKPDDTRWNPYAFLKAPSAIIAEGETILLPKGRTQIDWECEMGVVIGRRASHVPVERAADYIFGYTLELDVSDRGGRGDTRHGSDWLIGKSHDTFAPTGPFITPKEFIADPQKLKITYTLNGKLMQDSNTSLMIHNVFETVAYGSNILTLQPGDMIATGTPPGVGSGRKPPIFFKPGDVSVCTYEGVGTLTNRVAAAS